MKIIILVILFACLMFSGNMISAFAPSKPDHKAAFDDAEHVVIGKVLLVEILSELVMQQVPKTIRTDGGVALYEIEVEEYLKNPLNTNIIQVPGYYVDQDAIGVFDLIYEVDEKVILYIQPDTSDELAGYDLIIRSHESRSLDKKGPICSEPNTFYHEGNCLDIPDCPPNTKFSDGVCVVVDLDVPPFNQPDCLIATASFGSEMAPQVQMLREIRDDVVLKTYSGSLFMNGFNAVYYSFSPTIAQIENENPAFKEAVKIFITPMISVLPIMTFAEEGSEFQVIVFGISTMVLVVGMYVVIPTVVGFKIHGWLKSRK